MSRVQRFFSSFPSGRPGIGLLLLRLAASVYLVQQSRLFFDESWQMFSIGLIAIASAALLAAGLLTPIAAALGALAVLLADGPAHAYLLVVSLAVFLLGPGTYSVDARLFGRREIVITGQK